MFEISPTQDPRSLSQAVIQITDCLDMFQAELARVLHVRCADIGQLSCGKRCLEPATESWDQALWFVRMYQLLYDCFRGDRVAMIHWLRADNKALGSSPHLLVVDEDKLVDIVEHLESRCGASC